MLLSRKWSSIFKHRLRRCPATASVNSFEKRMWNFCSGSNMNRKNIFDVVLFSRHASAPKPDFTFETLKLDDTLSPQYVANYFSSRYYHPRWGTSPRTSWISLALIMHLVSHYIFLFASLSYHSKRRDSKLMDFEHEIDVLHSIVFSFQHITAIRRIHWKSAELRVSSNLHLLALSYCAFSKTQKHFNCSSKQAHTKIPLHRLAPSRMTFLHLNISFPWNQYPVNLSASLKTLQHSFLRNHSPGDAPKLCDRS